MYNPKFKEFYATCLSIQNKHADEISTFKTKWVELKDSEGEVYQIVPIFDITYKG